MSEWMIFAGTSWPRLSWIKNHEMGCCVSNLLKSECLNDSRNITKEKCFVGSLQRVNFHLWNKLFLVFKNRWLQLYDWWPFSVDAGRSAADSRHSKKRKRKHSSSKHIDSKALPKMSNSDEYKQHVKVKRKQRKNTNKDSSMSSSSKTKRGVKKLKHTHKQMR